MSEIQVSRPTEQELQALSVSDWPIWTCEPSTFDWEYDEPETCYLLAGKVKVTSSGGQVEFGAGDLVTFPSGLKCTWHVSDAVRKHYKFG